MDPAGVGTTARIASSIARPIIARLFVKEGPGAGLVDKPVQVSQLVRRGEKRKLNQLDLWKIARELVKVAIEANPHEPPIASDEREALADALAATLSALGDLEMDDVQAVRLGQEELARRLRGERPTVRPGSWPGRPPRLVEAARRRGDEVRPQASEQAAQSSWQAARRHSPPTGFSPGTRPPPRPMRRATSSAPPGLSGFLGTRIRPIPGLSGAGGDITDTQ
ncbi:NACHT N-terminal Helical domain 1-containing protein [Streptomyces sviceus]|uniref:NACHT N-terminal Helical domain 1-containing protein n=1 Tax=Streptomyces sviceus TaxID=285530 RepID=UPI003D9F4CA9